MLRREMLTQAIPAFAGLGVLPFIPNLSELSDHELMAQVGLMRELDGDSFGWIWSILKGVTDEELDWKINEEANSIRWIIGHLIWFEEWACDAIEETGLYLIDEQPSTSFQADTLEEMKVRFTAAREKFDALVKDLSADQIRKPRRYLYNDHDKKRAEMDLRAVLAIHSTHFYGHLYQIRMIRGTYSRVNETDKAKFDKW